MEVFGKTWQSNTIKVVIEGTEKGLCPAMDSKQMMMMLYFCSTDYIIKYNSIRIFIKLMIFNSILNYHKISLYLFFVGFGNLLCVWPFILLFYLTKSETVDWAVLPWTPLCASAVLATGKFYLFIHLSIHHYLFTNYSHQWLLVVFTELRVTASLLSSPGLF